MAKWDYYKSAEPFMSEERRAEVYAKALADVRASKAECERRIAASGHLPQNKQDFLRDSLAKWIEIEQKILDGSYQQEAIDAVKRLLEAHPDRPFGGIKDVVQYP